MKGGWQTKPLGEVCQVIGGGTPSKDRREYYVGKIPWATVRDMRSEVISETECKITMEAVRNSSTNIIPAGNVVIATRVGLGKVCMLGQDTAINQDLRGIIPNDQKTLSVRFLFSWLKSVKHLIVAEGTGATVQGVKLPFIKSLQVPIPPLPEQQRIVRILDEAFDGLTTATANAEKNLRNARVLLESYLQSIFTQRGKGWVDRTVGEIAHHSLGKMLDKSKNRGEAQPYLRNINVRWFNFNLSDLLEMRFLKEEADKYTVVKGDVLVCEGGYPGRAAIWDEDYPIHFQKALHRVRFNEPAHNKWFVYFLYAQDKNGDLRQHFTGTGIQHFTGEVLSRYKVPIAPLSEIQRLISRFDELSAETQHLESIYQQKLAALDELKKSLLHLAFTGQLTADSIAVSTPAPICFPTELEGISTTDLHAGILALSHQFHEKAGKLEHFGHVKAEKIAHMIEACLGIDLGRKPIKDAAGPNDFPHLHKVEYRARMANFFDFKRVERASYRVHKLRSFDRLIDKTRAALGSRANEVDGLLELMLPMQTQQAEIFCTVYAAWNNLLLDGKQPTDEQIVFEARENWHPDKLKISRERFFSAIEWIRNKSLIPPGKGKKVCSRVE